VSALRRKSSTKLPQIASGTRCIQANETTCCAQNKINANKKMPRSGAGTEAGEEDREAPFPLPPLHEPRAHPSCAFSLSYITIWSCIEISAKHKMVNGGRSPHNDRCMLPEFRNCMAGRIPPIMLKLNLAAVPSRMPKHTLPLFWTKHIRKRVSRHC
jgi:hypothetical protein